MHFAVDQLPPCEAYWSLTLYDTEGYPVPNSMEKYAVGSHYGLVKNTDGSVTLHISRASPGKDKELNWLPAPPEGSGVEKFVLEGRFYRPKEGSPAGALVSPAGGAEKRAVGEALRSTGTTRIRGGQIEKEVFDTVLRVHSWMEGRKSAFSFCVFGVVTIAVLYKMAHYLKWRSQAKKNYLSPRPRKCPNLEVSSQNSRLRHLESSSPRALDMDTTSQRMLLPTRSWITLRRWRRAGILL